jgi:hypothetical protein
LLEPPAQQPLRGEPVERMVRFCPPVASDGPYDSGQRLDRRHVTVDQRERLAVMGTHPDLEPDVTAP